MGSGIALHYSVQKTFRAKRDAGCPKWLMDTTLKSGITHFLPTQYMPFCLKSFSVILQGAEELGTGSECKVGCRSFKLMYQATSFHLNSQ